MSSKINLQTCEYARKSSIFQDNQLIYHTSVKSQGMKQLMAGGGVALVGITLIPLLSGLFG